MEDLSDCLTANDLWADTKNVKFALSLILLLCINVLVIGGNTLVILAVAKSKKLRSVTNLFIVSLAFADLFLGITILPFSTMLEVLHVWVFGRVWCVMYLAIDVWLCTASILNLVAISLDRYIAITHPMRYPSLMSRRRAKCLIAGVWVFAFIVCLPPLLNWGSGTEKSSGLINSTMNMLTSYDVLNSSDQFAVMSAVYDYNEGGPDDTPYIVDALKPKNCTDLSYLSCELTSSKGYRIYASIGSFYFPMCVMGFFYLRIYKTAVETAEALRKGTLTTKTDGDNDPNSVSITLRIHRGRAYGKTSWKDKKRKEPDREKHSETDSIRMNKSCKTYSHETVNKKNRSKLKKSYQGNSTEKNFSSGMNRHGYVRTFKRFYTSKQNTPCSIGLNVGNPGGSHICKNPSLDTASISSGSDIVELGKSNYAADDDSNHSDEKGQKVGLVVPDEQGRRRSGGAFNFKVVRKNAKSHRSKFRRETKAAKTLAIIVGVFILCWLPFFTLYLVEAFCIDCIPPMVFSIFFWLGYFNSALNPCIYALFSRDFRFAFKALLTCRKHYSHYSMENTTHVLRNMQVQSTFRESDSLSEF